jgi:hypothetical protein
VEVCFNKIHIYVWLWRSIGAIIYLKLEPGISRNRHYDFLHPYDGFQNSYLSFYWPFVDTECAIKSSAYCLSLQTCVEPQGTLPLRYSRPTCLKIQKATQRRWICKFV